MTSSNSHDSTSLLRSISTERRVFSRCSNQTEVITLHSEGDSIEGRLIDESIGGVSVCVDSVDNIRYGRAVRVNLRGVPHQGYVRSIRRDGPRQFRVVIGGIADDHDVRWPTSREIAHYFAYQDLLISCEILLEESPAYKTIQLWDGQRFQVANDQLRSRTPEARRAELECHPDDLSLLAQLYELCDDQNSDLLSRILDFEFAR